MKTGPQRGFVLLETIILFSVVVLAISASTMAVKNLLTVFNKFSLTEKEFRLFSDDREVLLSRFDAEKNKSPSLAISIDDNTKAYCALTNQELLSYSSVRCYLDRAAAGAPIQRLPGVFTVLRDYE